MGLSNLCTLEDVMSRLPDAGLASGSENPDDNQALINQCIPLACADITLDLIKKLQRVIAPYETDAYNNTPSMLVDKITEEAIAYLNSAAIIRTIYLMFEGGETRMRFRYQEAGDVLSKQVDRWERMYKQEFASVCPLLTFYQDGNRSVITLMERILMNQFSSVRVTV